MIANPPKRLARDERYIRRGGRLHTARSWQQHGCHDSGHNILIFVLAPIFWLTAIDNNYVHNSFFKLINL